MFSVRITGKEFTNINNFRLGLNFDAIASTFSFDALFDPDNEQHRVIFRPLSYRKCEVFANGELILTGTIINHKFTTATTSTLVGVSGYSVSGVFENSSIPVSVYPLETNTQSLKEIAEKIAGPFGVPIIVAADTSRSNTVETGQVKTDNQQVSEAADSELEKTATKPGQSVKSYLSKLASEKNLVLSNDKYGRMLITRAATGSNPIGLLVESGGTQMTLSANGAAVHDTITTVRQADEFTDNASETTITNPLIVPFSTNLAPNNRFVSNVRPLVKVQDSGKDDNSRSTTMTALSNEAKSISVSVTLDSWYIEGDLIDVNKTILLQSPRNFLFNPTKFFIQSAEFSGTPQAQTCVLKCVLPEVYTGQIPANPFLQ